MAKRSQLNAADYTLSRREVQKIIHAAVSFRDRCVVKTLYQTALRRFELRVLDVRDIDWTKRRVHIPKGKGDKERHVFLTEDLAADLRHSFARRWKDAGRSIESLSAVLGHESTATTMDVYGREDIDRVQANYEAVVEELL